jgi:DNA-binding response OmpR family regulator
MHGIISHEVICVPSLVLIIEDHPPTAKFISELLANRDLKTMIATDGGGGIIKAEEAKPELILLDIMMPGINGLEVLEKLRNNPKTAHIPVIFVSVRYESEFKKKGLELGAADYIVKPFKNERLIEAIEKILNN